MKKVVNLKMGILFTACVLIFFGCKKDSEIPAVTTSSLDNVTETTVKAGGNVKSSGGVSVSDRGICWSISPEPSITDNFISAGAGTGPFTCDITGLSENTKYYVRAYATNTIGTAYGDEINFTTLKVVALATVLTAPVTRITVASAFSEAHITDDGGEEPTETGICWGTSANPTTGNNKSISGIINGLMPSTTYFVRAYAINRAGTAYGDEVNFTTNDLSPLIFNPDLTYGTVSDADGNSYKTIQIGTQVWMAENLRTTKYNGGGDITYITEETRGQEGFAWYDDNPDSFKNTFGALYNWYALTDSRKLCPSGWHVPSNEEWNTLANYLGGSIIAGGKLKEAGTAHWSDPNSAGFNESGFTAIPGGGLTLEDGDIYFPLIFSGIGYDCYYWSSTTTGPADYEATYITINYSLAAMGIGTQTYKVNALSVRCVQDGR